MGKKSTSDSGSEPQTDADTQRNTDLVIAPEKKTPKLDTSKWPLLLKVGPGAWPRRSSLVLWSCT